MSTDQTHCQPAPRDSGEFQIVSMEPTGRPHTYRVTTFSKRYGHVTQEVVMFPESILTPGHRRDETEKAATGYRTDEHG